MSLDTLIHLLVCLALAAFLGILSQKVLRLKVGGLFIAILVGFAGAYLGKEAASWFSLPEIAYLSIRGRSFPLLWSFIGALVFTLVVAGVAARRRKPAKK
jgi:uncharacterized membrane protein YeaQ/YmgE (transglycosylase-associated protein family)